MTLLLLSTFLLSFASCKKDKNENPEATKGTATAVLKTDDATINFSSVKDSSVAFLEFIEDANQHHLRIVIKDDKTNALIEMMITPVKDAPQTLSIAQGFTADGWAATSVFLNGRNSSEAETYGTIWVSHDGNVTNSEGSLTISSISENNIKGSFNGTLYSYNPDTKVAKKLTVTQGQFDMPLVRRNFVL